MKKLLSLLFLLVAVLFTACNDNDVDVEGQKVLVGINLLTDSDSGLVVKSTNTQDGEEIARVNTPACVKSLTITATGAQGTEEKTFTFTEDLSDELGDQTAVDEDGDSSPIGLDSGTDMNMYFWGGSNSVSAKTTSYAETPSTDPVTTEADGISSNVTYEFDNNSHLWGIDENIMTKFWADDNLANKITNTTTLAQDVKHVLRSIAPFAEFKAEPTSYYADFSVSNTLNLNATTENSRIIVTCQFDDGTYDEFMDGKSVDIDGNYSATIEAVFTGTVSDAGSTCPARTIYANKDWLYLGETVSSQTAWFYWSNSFATNNKQLGFNIIIKQDNVEVNRIQVLDNTDLLLTGGKDIWVNIIIPESVVKYGASDLNISYNWDNEDRQIILN